MKMNYNNNNIYNIITLYNNFPRLTVMFLKYCFNNPKFDIYKKTFIFGSGQQIVFIHWSKMSCFTALLQSEASSSYKQSLDEF